MPWLVPPSCSRLAPVAALLFLLLAGVVPAAAQDGRVAAEECCLPLLFPIGARAVALGDALSARGGMDAIWVNPAGLSQLERDELRVHNAPTDIETSNTFSVAFRIRSAGAVALSYRLVDYGDIDNTGSSGEPLGTLSLYNQVILATFATGLGRGLSAGVSYKLYQFRQTCELQCGVEPFTATSHGLDLGVQYHPPAWPALQLGASIVHTGTALQVINADQASPMPTRLRAGAAYEVMHHFTPDSTTAVWVLGDVTAGIRDGVPLVAGGGVELVLDRTIFVRAGYRSGDGRNAGAAVGVGLRYERFDVGIARTFLGSAVDDDPFQITFSLGF